jgi:transposase InsO family protein
MSGRWIKSRQVEIYMNARKTGYTQQTAAAKAGISERSGRNIEKTGPTLRPEKRHWRTRQDPLNGIWEQELVPLLEKLPDLQPITLLEHMQLNHPGDYPDSLLRTLQRRVKQWRALYGPEKEVMFRQTHEAGRLGLSDFTKLKLTTITIAGCPLDHLLYHFRLAWSHWSYMKVILGGESYAALAEGLQEALQRLGGTPQEHRTDSLSAAYKNLGKAAQEDMTIRYKCLCEHYGMRASRNNRGLGHENGCVESPHGHLKRRIEQALLLRGSNDFPHIQDYQDFIDMVVQQHNQRNAKMIKMERAALQALPLRQAIDYTEISAVVSSSSTIDVKRVTYTVPSRLIGETLHVRLYDDRLLCYLGHQEVVALVRIYPQGKTIRARQVDYRHVILSLIKKPQAFRHSQLRDDLLPNADYRNIWTMVDSKMPAKQACKFIVGLLHLASTENCEKELAEKVLDLLNKGRPLSLTQLQEQFKSKNVTSIPVIEITQHQLNHYDTLIPVPREVCYA